MNEAALRDDICRAGEGISLDMVYVEFKVLLYVAARAF